MPDLAIFICNPWKADGVYRQNRAFVLEVLQYFLIILLSILTFTCYLRPVESKVQGLFGFSVYLNTALSDIGLNLLGCPLPRRSATVLN